MEVSYMKTAKLICFKKNEKKNYYFYTRKNIIFLFKIKQETYKEKKKTFLKLKKLHFFIFILKLKKKNENFIFCLSIKIL